MTLHTMPSPETKEDPRLVELTAVNGRLKIVLGFLKTKHTTATLDYAIERAESGIGDKSAAFVPMDSTMIKGTRHMDSLIQLAEMLEIKAEIGQVDHAMDECTALLEKKILLLRDIYKV